MFDTIKKSLSITSYEIASIYGLEHELFIIFAHPIIERKIKEYNETISEETNRIYYEHLDFCPKCHSYYEPYLYTKCPRCGYDIVNVIHYYRGEHNRKSRRVKTRFVITPLSTELLKS